MDHTVPIVHSARRAIQNWIHHIPTPLLEDTKDNYNVVFTVCFLPAFPRGYLSTRTRCIGLCN